MNYTKLKVHLHHNKGSLYTKIIRNNWLQTVCYLDKLKSFFYCDAWCQIIDWPLIVRKECKKPRTARLQTIPGHFPLEIHMSSFGNCCDWVGRHHYSEGCFILEGSSYDQCDLVQWKSSDTNLILPSARGHPALRRIWCVFQRFFCLFAIEKDSL